MGKGSNQRPTDKIEFDKNMEVIFGRRKKDDGDSRDTDETAQPTEKNDNRINQRS